MKIGRHIGNIAAWILVALFVAFLVGIPILSIVQGAKVAKECRGTVITIGGRARCFAPGTVVE